MPVDSAVHNRAAADPVAAATADTSDSDSDSSASGDLTTPMPIVNTPPSAPHKTATEASELSDVAASNRDAAAPALRYSVDLLQSFPEVCQKAKSGVQTCHAVAAFVQERANMEVAYSKALLRVAQNAKADDWAPQLSRAWRVVQATLEKGAVERAAFASTMQLSMVSAVRAFASQQEIQVQRLITEGTKVRTAQQHMTASLHKAKDKYDRKCADAADVTANLRTRATETLDSVASALSPFSFDSSSSSDDNAREIAEKLTAGAGQLLTKMWDSTSSFGKSSLERQRSKVDSCLEDVIAAEKSYVQIVDFMNAQRLVYEREITENLHAFQLTEEQRIEYLKDLLLRLQKAFAKAYEHSIELLAQLRDSVYAINELADIEDAFKKLVEMDGGEGGDALDLSTNAFYKRMIHIESLSEQGHQMVKVVSSTFTDLIAAEDIALRSLQKQLQIHDSGSASSSSSGSDLFGSSTLLVQTSASYLADEGTSMKAGWQVARDQVQLLLNVHQEFRSLLAEPVALSMATMRQQYENARAATHDNFAKSHASLSAECSSHAKLQHRLASKARDFLSVFSASVQDASAINLSTSTITAEQTSTLLQQYSNAIPDRRVESKLRHLSDEMRDLQHRVAESDASLKDSFNTYIQDVEVFVSVYMKNEKYRLQIKKSSLLAFVKAYEHMLTGALAVTTRATAIMDTIDPSSDVREFVESHRKPHEQSKRVVPAYHNNDILKDALSEYYRTKMSSPTAEERRQHRSPNAADSAAGPSPQKTTAKRALALDLDVIASPADRSESPPASSENNASPVPSAASEAGAVAASVEASESDAEAQPLAMSEFQKKFQLESPEQVVESYSCALYLSNFPYHGRLYLTRDHICFTGWRDTTYVASYLDIAHIEKKNTALIVPNAIELIVKGERVFFASFVFRDECFQCLQQLQAIKKGTVALMTGRAAAPAAPSGESDAVRESLAPAHVVERTMESVSGKTSPVSAASVAPTPLPQSDTEAVTAISEATATTASVASRGDVTTDAVAPPVAAPVRRVPERDVLLDEYEIILDEVVAMSVDFAYSTLWVESAAFFQQLLHESGETNIRISDWTKTPVTCTAVSKPETFDGSRCVRFTHNKKYMVGPSTIPTTQEQRYKLDPSVRLIVSSSSTVTDVPYCDYFRAENRWVFSATATDGECRVQVGIRIRWLKSTWLKKQIESAAVSEGRETVKVWLAAALKAAKSHSAAGRAAPTAPVLADATNADEKAARAKDDPLKAVAPAPAALSMTSAAAVAPSADSVSETLQGRVGVAPETVSLKLALQVASLCCLLMFLYTMHRVCATLEHMEMLTRESLLQQRQQQELFKDVLQAFLARDRVDR